MPDARRDYRRAMERTPSKAQWWPLDTADDPPLNLAGPSAMTTEANVLHGAQPPIVIGEDASSGADGVNNASTRMIAVVSPVIDANLPVSLEAWLRPWDGVPFAGDQRYLLYSSGPTLYARLQSNDVPFAVVSRTDSTSLTTQQAGGVLQTDKSFIPKPGQTLHVAITFGGKPDGVLRLYMNGELVGYSAPETGNVVTMRSTTGLYLPVSTTAPAATIGASDWQHVAHYTDEHGPELWRWHYRVGIGAEDVDLTIGDALWRIVQKPNAPATLDGSYMMTHKGYAIDLSDALRDGVLTADEQLLTKLLGTGFFQLQT